MAKISSVKFSKVGFNWGMLILRVGTAFMIFKNHGLMKIENFNAIAPHFHNPLHIGSYASFILVIFAEVICAPLVILGLFTRWAAIPLIIELLVLIFLVHGGFEFSDVEVVFQFLIGFVVILILGPGKISLDGLISKG